MRGHNLALMNTTIRLTDCTLVHPDNAVGLSYASYCARARFVQCRMIALNFTQPEMGGKSTGIICTEKHRPEGRLHVDLEDCTLAGYSVFTPGNDAKAKWFTINAIGNHPLSPVLVTGEEY